VAVWRKGYSAAFLTALAFGDLMPQHLEVLETSSAAPGNVESGAGQRESSPVVAGLGVCEIDALVGCVFRRKVNTQHATLALPVNCGRTRQYRFLSVWSD